MCSNVSIVSGCRLLNTSSLLKSGKNVEYLDRKLAFIHSREWKRKSTEARDTTNYVYKHLTFIWGKGLKIQREERNVLSKIHKYFYILWPSIIGGGGGKRPSRSHSVHHCLQERKSI